MSEHIVSSAPRGASLPTIAHLIVSLRVGGAERLALDILRYGKNRCNGLLECMYQEPGPMRARAESEGIEVNSLGFYSPNSLSCITTLTKELRAKNVDLLHVHAEYLLLAAIPAALLTRVPLVLTVHSKHDMEHFPKLYRFMRLAKPLIRTLVCVSEPLKEYYITTMGYRPERVHVIQNGVDMSLFTPQGERASLPWDNPDDLFVFGNVARLHEAKDLGNLIRAFSIVHARHPQTRLLLVGEGEERAFLEKLIAELKLANVIRITGTRDDIPSVLRSLNLFVLSSRHEGMPMAVLEAMACGVPILSTTVGDIVRLNTKKTCVALVTPENSPALADKMMELMHDSQLRKTLTENASQCVSQNYSAEASARAYYSLYKQNGVSV